MTKILAAALAAVLLTCAPAAAQLDTRTLPEAATLTGSERMPAVQGSGCTVKTTPCASVAITPTILSTFLQPIDADLTAIAALVTTATGRDLLTSGDAAAIRSKAGLGSAATYNVAASGANVPLMNAANIWQGNQTLYATLRIANATNTALGMNLLVNSASQLQISGAVLINQGLTVTGTVQESTSVTPASATDTCIRGQHAWDASYEYRCVATNTWRRAALSAW